MRTRGPGCVPSRRRRRRAGRKHLCVCGAFAPSTSAGLERGLLKRGSETMAPKGVTDVATLQSSFSLGLGRLEGGYVVRRGRRQRGQTAPPDVRLHVTHAGLCCLQSASQWHLHEDDSQCSQWQSRHGGSSWFLAAICEQAPDPSLACQGEMEPCVQEPADLPGTREGAEKRRAEEGQGPGAGGDRQPLGLQVPCLASWYASIAALDCRAPVAPLHSREPLPLLLPQAVLTPPPPPRTIPVSFLEGPLGGVSGRSFEDDSRLSDQSVVHAHRPHFLALHCQEFGGKNYEASMSHVDKFVRYVPGQLLAPLLPPGVGGTLV
ncbi:hypothetical protein J1605_003408 [Eschrichtius robustus]|uniref:Uncharacterized protein n=1 Tax=Eschrichtius robustus TaxID=9764 RepID=A0AB34HP38_ESCRO|nr:hypothetical protein J1605_003408 [Eschrichtius robustus]